MYPNAHYSQRTTTRTRSNTHDHTLYTCTRAYTHTHLHVQIHVSKKKVIHFYTDYLTYREKPLALYVFSLDKGTLSLILNNTSSGSVLINDTVLHATGSFSYSNIVKSFHEFICMFFLFFQTALH